MEPNLGYVYPKTPQNENDYHKLDRFLKSSLIRSALLMAASQSRRLSSERALVLSPWFFITFGTPQKEICGHFVLSLEHPTIKQNDGISTRSASCQVSSNATAMLTDVCLMLLDDKRKYEVMCSEIVLAKTQNPLINRWIQFSNFTPQT